MAGAMHEVLFVDVASHIAVKTTPEAFSRLSAVLVIEEPADRPKAVSYCR